MEPLHNPLYLIVAPANPRRGELPGYYAPVSVEDYEAGITLPGLKPAPGWDVIATDDYNYPLYSSKTNKRLRQMGIDIIPGDGLKAFQKAALDNALTERARREFRQLWLNLDLATLAHFRIEGLPEWSGWGVWDSLEALGWVDGTASEMRQGRKRRGYRLTTLGRAVIEIAAEVYGWNR